MNNTSYQIRYSAMDTFYMQVSQRIGAWKEDLAAIQTALNNVVNMEGFSGDAADNLRAYVSEVHLLAYQTLLQVMSEYQSRLLLYKDGYHDIDSNIYATMTKWTMSDYYNKVQQNEADMLSEAAAIRQALMNVSDLLWVGEPGKGTLQTDMEYILSESDKLDATITSYESAEQARAINSLTNLLDSLHEMLTYYKGLNSDIQGYQKGDYATNEIIQTLAGNYQVSMEYLADNQEAANAAYERLSASYEQMRADYEAACEAREDAGRAEIIMGLAAVVVGTAAIICTAGAATPVVVALGVTAGAGSVMYGVSNITEGGQEVYYGATGDLESASWNPIRDTVFCGNQSAYDAWGNLNMTIAGLCIPISGAVAQSAAQGGTVMAKTVAVTTAKELFKDKVSDFAVAGIVGAMDQQFDLNQTEQALCTIGLNVGLDKLGDGVSARFKNTASTSPISTDTVQNLKAVEYGSGIDVASGAAKVDVDVKPLDGGAAGIGKNADGNLKNTGFVSGMSASDAARYNAWVDSCINGTHNGYPGLSVDDIAKLEIADAHVAEAIAVSKVDADAYLNLKAVEYGSGIKNVAEAPKAEVDIKPLEGATVGSESGSNSTVVSKLTSADVKVAIEKNGMSVEDFSKLLDPNRMLTPDELKFVDRVRADIGLPEVGTVMNKTIPQSDIYNYLYNENYSGVRGFVSVDEHSNTLKTLADVFEGNRLDYNNTAFKTGSGVDGISKSVGNADTVYGKITYVLDDADGIKVPDDFPIEANAPYTGRGFTGSKNIVLPELVQDTRLFVDGDILGIYDAKTGALTQQFVYDSDLGWLLR